MQLATVHAKHDSSRATVVAFFAISVAYKIGWTTISSLLAQLSKQYGPEVLLYLNVAYFLPSIPVLLCQSLAQEWLDRTLGVQRSILIRFILGLGGLAAALYAFPASLVSQRALLSSTALIGVLYGVAFGTSYQLVGNFPRENTVALTTGFVSSGVVVLLLDLLLKRGPYYSPAQLVRLCHLASLHVVAGLLAACWVTLREGRRLAAAEQSGSKWYSVERTGRRGPKQIVDISTRAGHHLGQRRPRLDSTPGPGALITAHAVDLEDGVQSPLLGGSSRSSASGSIRGSSDGGGGGDGGSSASGGGSGGGSDKHRSLRLWRVLLRVWPAATAIFLSTGSSMLVFPFFTYVHSVGPLGVRLPQVLFYVRLAADILGRLVPARLQARTGGRLMFWVLVKLALVPLLFANIFMPRRSFGDAGAVVLVAAFWLLSGYCNTCAYLVAPSLVPQSFGSYSSYSAKVGSVMTLAFQTSCFGGLMLAFAIQHMRLF